MFPSYSNTPFGMSPVDVMDFPEDNSASVGLEMPRRPQAKQVEKSKETNRKIFSGPKKVRSVLWQLSLYSSPGSRSSGHSDTSQ